ncbi:MAG: T9SS type A sorting domain-containing protein, partial [Bacteroidales bacterium]|nr:T9SS type A sorting domain-containing protein [Bacteroidales bacterium]
LWQWGFYFTLDSSGYVFDNILSPSCIDSNDKWLMISAGMEHAFALKEDGTLWAYGDNVNFALGDTSIVVANEFTQITQNKDWKHVEAGSIYTFALNNQGELFAWGINMYGQLGIVEKNDYVEIPTKVSNETEWLSISAAKGGISDIYIFGMHSVAIKNDDKNNLICVTGANYVGQLGLGSTDQEKNTPFVCNALNVENVLLDESTDISLYPNPATTQLTLDNKDALIKEAHIYDITGRKVSRHSINANQSTLDISTLKSGLYIVKIHTEQGVLNRKVQVVR